MTGVGPFEHGIEAQKVPGDWEIARLAERQHGVVSRGQLLELGCRRGAIQHRLDAGRLHALHRGVYRVGHRRLLPNGRWMAAVLACGPEAVLSHVNAGGLWGIRRTSTATTHVTVPGRSRHGVHGVVLHRVRRLDPADVTVHDGIPVTTVARTLLDLAEVDTQRRLERAYEDAERLRLLDVRAVQDVLRRCRGRRGIRPPKAVVARIAGPPEQTRSELERFFLDVCRDADLPPPAVNAPLLGFEVDALWRDQRLIVELDSRAFHATRAAFERDRARDTELQVAGYRVVRVTHRRLEREPAAVARAVRSLLSASWPKPGSRSTSSGA